MRIVDDDGRVSIIVVVLVVVEDDGGCPRADKPFGLGKTETLNSAPERQLRRC